MDKNNNTNLFIYKVHNLSENCELCKDNNNIITDPNQSTIYHLR